MDIRLLEYFLRVVERGTVTEAAASLYIAQPSLSQAIRGLEQELGARLFERSGRRLRLTTAGESLVEPARRVLRGADDASEAVAAVRRLERGQLDIAAPASLVLGPLARLVGEFHRQHPHLFINLIDPGGSAEVVSEVRTGGAELGLVDLPFTEELEVVPISPVRLSLILATSLSQSVPNPTPLDVVKDLPLIVETGDVQMRAILDTALAETDLNVVVECADHHATWELVMKGVGASFIPTDFIVHGIGDLTVRRTDPPILRPVGLAHRNKRLSPAAAAFMRLAQDSDSLTQELVQ